MTFKNNLRRGQAPLEIDCRRQSRAGIRILSLTGQASLEYFILFAIIATLTIVSLTSGNSVLSKIQDALQGTFFQKTVDRMVK